MQIPNWPQILLNNESQAPSLDRCRLIFEALGLHEKQFPKTIHVAGTNGKGSTIAMLKSILEEAGYRVDTYTSPHIVDFNERITLAGQNISPYYFQELLDQVKFTSDKLSINPAFFEGVTLAAFLAFSKSSSDFLLLETGLGGEFDPTNLIPNPLLTIITPISYDHMNVLGPELTSIAKAKAGIIKPNTPCIISSQTDEVYDLLLEKCEELSAPSFCYGFDYGAEKVLAERSHPESLIRHPESLIRHPESLIRHPREGGDPPLPGICARDVIKDGRNDAHSFAYLSQKYTINLPAPSLQGDHQLVNAASVVAAILLMNSHFKITEEQIAKGLQNTKWPGRIEKIEQVKYQQFASQNVQIYLDGAHNESSARCLAIWAYENLEDPIYLILGMTRNRNIEDFCQYFVVLTKEARSVRVLSEPSSYNADFLSEKASKMGLNMVASESLEEAIREISLLTEGKRANIIITGSLFLVSDFYKLTSENVIYV